MRIASLILLASAVVAVPFKRYDNSSDAAVSSGFSAEIVPVSSTEFVSVASATAEPSAVSTYVEGESESEVDTTITVDEWITITLSDTTLTLNAKSTSAVEKALAAEASTTEDDTTITSTITQYQTITSDGVTTEVPVSTVTTTYVEDDETVEATTTSTVTRITTVTLDDGSVTTEAATDVCEATTVTVTVTETPSAADVVTTSYPITAEFTVGDLTTTITSFVEVTTTLASTTSDPVSLVPSASASATPYYNSTVATNGTVYSSAAVPVQSESVANERRSLFHFF